MFDDSTLGEVSAQARWLFMGLLTQADKSGRIAEDLQRLRLRLCGFEQPPDLVGWLRELSDAQLLVRYAVEGKTYIQIRSFAKHQRPHPKEPDSVIPPPPTTARRVKKRRAATENVEPASNGSLDTGSLDTGSPLPPTGGTLADRIAEHETARRPTRSAVLDRLRVEFTAAYPPRGRVGGVRVQADFRGAFTGRDVDAHYATMRAALALHIASEQWQDPSKIPLLTTWLRQERWNQTLPPARHQPAQPPPDDQALWRQVKAALVERGCLSKRHVIQWFGACRQIAYDADQRTLLVSIPPPELAFVSKHYAEVVTMAAVAANLAGVKFEVQS
jgi:hypothetical protein